MRLRTGELVGGAAAVGLLVVLCLDWFEARGELVCGWNALSKFTLVVLCVAVALALTVVAVTVTRRAVAIQMFFDVVASAAGVFAVLVLAIALLMQPSLGDNIPSAEVAVRWPAYAGLALTILMTVGMWRAMADERLDAPSSAYPPPPPSPLGGPS